LRQVYGENLCGLYLFGSFARREEEAESDVDVAIVFRDLHDYWQEIQRTGPIVAELSLKYDVSISPMRIREATWLQEDSPFLNSLRKECIPL
jgi:predicted nucleotidyltransferase